MAEHSRFRRLESGLLVPDNGQREPASSTSAIGLQVFVDHATVFPDEPATFDDFKHIVRGLSRTDALFWAARLNILVSDPSGDNKAVQGDCIGVFFEPDSFERINNFARTHGGREYCTVFFRGQLLELMRWIALLSVDLPGDGETFNSPAVRRAFARAALLASDVWQRRVYGDRLNSTEPIDARRRAVLGAIRLSNMESASGSHPMAALARGYSLFADRMRSRAAEVEQAFENATGVAIDDYYSMAAYVAAEGLGRSADGLHSPDKCGMFSARLCEEAEACGALARAFFAKEAQTADELRDALWGHRSDAEESDAHVLALKPFRDRPILRTPDGRAIVLDPRSFIERLSVGPLFQLVAGDRKHQNRWFALFGEIFEEYCHALFHRIYPTAAGLARRFIPGPHGTDATGSQIELADGLLVDGRDAVLFEMKAVWIPDAVVSPEQDGGAYIEEIRRRYSVGGNDGRADRKVKGVGQLARTIEHLATGEWKSEDAEFDPSARIIPILLVHDPHLDAPVHSHVLAQEFAALMRKGDRGDDWSEMRVGQRRIAHLIVLTLDDLETLETSSNKFAIIDCLREYAAACPDRMVSVHNFLAASRFRPLLRHNAWLAERFTEILNRSMKRILPGQNLPESDQQS